MSFRNEVIYSKSLTISAMLFNMVVMAANFVGQKPLSVFGLIVSAGSTIFPLTYLISVLVTEIFGREHTKNIIRTGFICNMLVAIFISLTIHFPHPLFWNKQLQYEVIMQQTWQIFILSSLAYIVSEFTNLNVFTYVTKKLKQKHFRFRAFCSTLCAVIVDTLFLIPIMIKSSPTYMIIAHKVFSLIIFKSTFVFSGLLFIAFVRDFILKKEGHSFNIEIGQNKGAKFPYSNVYWYRQEKR